MSLDPYGYAEPPAAVSGAVGAGDHDAISAMWFASASLVLNSMAPCTCYFPGLIALPMAAYALYKGSVARSSPLSPSGMACANAALVCGSVGTIFGMFFAGMALFMFLYFAAIFGFAFLGIVAGAAGA